ncbi:PAN2-PAN3 deadenylation complex catalytic subunit PAN2 [Gryllus bimaculatus]|nr:PAN2-PAN3 deadenylation complex catalytic subunit PAN2 [Gryllus bimaculatus]
MEYPGISHFDHALGPPPNEILLYGDTASSYEVQGDSYDLPTNDFVSTSPHFGHDYGGEFHETRTVFADGGERFGATTVTFDRQEELVWVGNQGGHVTSYYGPGMQKHTSFRVHNTQEVRQIASLDDSILALTQNSLRCQMRRGIPLFTHGSDNMVDMLCLLQIAPDIVLMGGHQEKIIEFNLNECQETGEHSTSSSGCAILRQHGRFICAGDPSGRIELRALNSLKIEHILDAHSGSLSDFDVHGNTLVTCGFSKRQGGLSVDRFLMVYDLRMMRAITPIQLMLDPLLLRFLPSFSSRLAIVSGIGQMQLVDTVAIAQQPDLYHINTGGVMCLSFDVSSSCQYLIFGDAAGTVHLYTSNAHAAMFNTFSQETEFADPVESLPPMSIDDMDSPIASIPLPYPVHGTPLKTPPIDPEILCTMKMQGTIGYAPNPYSSRRNQMRLQYLKRAAYHL